jgi:hypothetical protein
VHSELDAGVRTVHGYTVEKAVADWLAERLPDRAAKTVEVNRDALRPLLAVIGTIPLKDLTVQDVRMALSKMATTHATRTLPQAAGRPDEAGRLSWAVGQAAAVGACRTGR